MTAHGGQRGGDKDFFPQAEDELFHPGGKVLQAVLPLVQLPGGLAVAQDGTGQKFWEQGGTIVPCHNRRG